MNQTLYELALELKEAGYPQNPYDKYGRRSIIALDPKGGEVVIPELSGLIDECGDRLKVLRRNKKSWLAWDDDFALNNWNKKSAKGKTPEIAMAKLYLKLNKK